MVNTWVQKDGQRVGKCFPLCLCVFIFNNFVYCPIMSLPFFLFNETLLSFGALAEPLQYNKVTNNEPCSFHIINIIVIFVCLYCNHIKVIVLHSFAFLVFVNLFFLQYPARLSKSLIKSNKMLH